MFKCITLKEQHLNLDVVFFICQRNKKTDYAKLRDTDMDS